MTMTPLADAARQVAPDSPGESAVIIVDSVKE